jgi:hypothetical protein
MIRTLSSSGSVLTEFTTQLFFRSEADQRADHFGFARQIARPAGHHQRGGPHRFQLDAVDAANVTTGGGYAASITLGVQIT